MSSANETQLPAVVVMTVPGLERLTEIRIRELRAKGIRYKVVDLAKVLA